MKAAKAELKKLGLVWDSYESLCFVRAPEGTAERVEAYEFRPGDRGHFSLEPVVCLIWAEVEEYRGQDREVVTVDTIDGWKEVEEDEPHSFCLGAFSYVPSDDGREINSVPIVLDGRAAVETFMRKWGQV
jgi:hypothetical protein